MEKAVFIDRDGTLIKDVGYLSREEDIEIISGSSEAVKMLRSNGYKVIIITNQAAIARGILTEEKFKILNNKILKQFIDFGAEIDASYYCPHHPTEGNDPYKKICDCRKPSPGLIIKAAKDNNIDLKASYMVGDKDIDIEAGKRAGCKTILVLTGYGREFGSNPDLKTDYTAKNLADAAKWIINN